MRNTRRIKENKEQIKTFLPVEIITKKGDQIVNI